MSTTIQGIACAACGCICEDITVRIDDGVITAVRNACSHCAGHLLGQTAGEPRSPQIAEAVELLRKSRAPLVYGLLGSTVEAQRAAISLVEAVGGTIDLALPTFHRDSLQAMQSVGISTCTLGEVRQRSDLVVFWGADPTATHPALVDRFINLPSQFDTAKRTVISVGAHTPGHPVDRFIQIRPADTLAAFAVLRTLAMGRELSPTDANSEQLSWLANRLQCAEYSVFLYGADIGGVAEIESLFHLVRHLNARSRCAAIALGSTQCENVLTWQTGYPLSVNFALGYPRYDPYRYSASVLLERSEVDSVVLIGDTGFSELSKAAQLRIADVPVVHVGFSKCLLPFDTIIRIVAARPGVQCGGTTFRMDGVPLKLRPVFNSQLPTTEAVLTEIQQGVCTSCV